MEKVQVHPTGLVDPKEPDAKIKFLAAEALRGVGWLLLNGEGKRFCDELNHRDYVTGETWKNKGGIDINAESEGSHKDAKANILLQFKPSGFTRPGTCSFDAPTLHNWNLKEIVGFNSKKQPGVLFNNYLA
ncbi:succinate dehydrogenase/fumarate reductase flavo protein [Gigaspora rosea]|uniref:Succinate dehydrogenase/fumarate reductase flavo protein n=1 Tax=Gigaspora rosea TaxID=44941 RepID=A0A397UVR2_9GLOM|nr:succinate dehydrogenase/fumarate reductase flavo protein [Gigaspora rosea]